MFSEKLKLNQPFATEFFEAALSSGCGRFSHAYMFTGNDPLAQYNLAMQVAKVLNCSKDGSSNCDCVNCNWIRQNRHPAVITVSPIDYLYGNEDGKPKTVITIGQAKYLKQSLSVASQYHRVVIFTDAAEGKEYEVKSADLWQDYVGELTPPSLDVDEEIRLSWIPQPLTAKTLHQESANALLKTIEEPSGNVTFFFLTKDSEDMLQTIVSRTQVVPVRSQYRKIPDISVLENFFKVFPPKNYPEAIGYSERLLEIAKEKALSDEDLLDIMQEYMRLLLRENAENKAVSEKIIQNIRKIHQAQDEISSYVNAQAVFDSLMIGLVGV